MADPRAGTARRVTVLTQPGWHPFEERLAAWIDAHGAEHEISRRTAIDDLPGGDVLFIVSFHERVPAEARSLYERCYVPHASALPAGRGWSPLEWRICEGADEITVSLILAEDEIDAGGICAQTTFPAPRHELRDEIEQRLFTAELELMERAIGPEHPLPATAQAGEATTYRRRTPADSAIDPHAPLADQFDVIRISDPRRFPAYFDLRGHRYAIWLERMDGE